MITFDPIAYATGGYYNSNKLIDLYAMGSEGLMAELAIVIPVEPTPTRKKEPQGMYLIPDDRIRKREEELEIVEDDEEVLLIIKMFIAVWQSQ